MNIPQNGYFADFASGQADGSVLVRLFKKGVQLNWQQVLTELRREPAFALWYNSVLAETNLAAFLWEHPPLRKQALTQEYEFRLYPAASMIRLRSDVDTFTKYFDTSAAVYFPNLGKNAELIVPTPADGVDLQVYAHLAAFVRGAAQSQQVAFWRLVAERILMSVGSDPLYVSTHGFGVFWLHVRLEGRPKYYRTDYRHQ